MANKLTFLSNKDDEQQDHYPFQTKKQSLAFVREREDIRTRLKLYQAIQEVKSSVIQAIHSFFTDHDFLQITAPAITPFDAEGAGEAFQINRSKDFFGKIAFLSVTSQFYSETMAQTFGKVYVFGPTFRADQSKTTRHAAEFWMLEPEWITNKITDICSLAEKLIKFIAQHINSKRISQLSYCGKFFKIDLLKRVQNLFNSNFESIEYKDAIKIINQISKAPINSSKYLSFGDKINKEHETTLSSVAFQAPVFITNYPSVQKAFYMDQSSNSHTAKCVDLLLPGVGEILGGSIRTASYEQLIKQIKDKKMSTENLDWYIALRRLKYVQTGGFGLGVSRLVMYLTGATNIKDVISFSRAQG